MKEWIYVRAGDFIEFNPRLNIKKGITATKISMDKLQPFSKKILGAESAVFTGGAKFRNGDTIMARITPCLENGKTAFVDILNDGEIGFGSTEFIVLRARKGISDPQFIYYLATSPFFRKQAIKSMVGSSGRQRVQQNVLDNLELKVPDIVTQEKIGYILSCFDKKIAINKQINDNLELQAQSLVTEYIEKTPYTTHLSDIITFDNGFAFQSKTYLKQGKYKIITIKNVQDGRIDSTGTAFINELPQRMRENCILSIGDILLSLTGNVGRVGIVYEKNLLLNQRVARVVPFDKQLLPFLYFVFRQPSIKTQLEMIAKGTAQLNLSPIEALNLTISYEQSSATALSQSLEALYKIIISNQQENLLLAQLRDTLLPKLMSGKIDVSSVQL